MDNQLSIVQQNYAVLKKENGFDAFAKLFELAGSEPEQAKSLAEKECYHLAQLMSDNEDLAKMPPGALVMELRKIPLQGVSLDPSLKLAYLIVDDKNKGKCHLEVTGRGKAVQAIAQNILKDVDVQVMFEGDELVRENGQFSVFPDMKENAKVKGGIITLTFKDGKIKQEVYNESHIKSWMARSTKRFFGKTNPNYTSFNGGIEPGFMQSKMLKHKLDRIGINPFPNAYSRNKEIADTLPEVTEDISYEDFTPDQPAPETFNDNQYSNFDL